MTLEKEVGVKKIRHGRGGGLAGSTLWGLVRQYIGLGIVGTIIGTFCEAVHQSLEVCTGVVVLVVVIIILFIQPWRRG